MHDQQVYETARVKNPKAFELADEMIMKYLGEGMIIVRSMTGRYQDLGKQASEVEVLSFNDWRYPGQKEESHEILLHLKFRSEEDSKTMNMTDALFVDGPLWNGKPFKTKDVVNQVGFIVHEWIEKEHFDWATPDCPQFSGLLKLNRDTLVNVKTPHHPFILPVLSACLGYLCGSHIEKLRLIDGTTFSPGSTALRARTLDSLERRLGAFVMQARHEAAKTCFGDLV